MEATQEKSLQHEAAESLLVTEIAHAVCGIGRRSKTCLDVREREKGV